MGYFVIIFVSRTTENAPSNRWRNQFENINLIVFASVAGWDFGFGATSWFWPAPLFLRMLTGAGLYFVLHILWIDVHLRNQPLIS